MKFLKPTLAISLAITSLAFASGNGPVKSPKQRGFDQMQQLLGYSVDQCVDIYNAAEDRVVNFSNLRPADKQTYLKNLQTGKKLLSEGQSVNAFFHLYEAKYVFEDSVELKSCLGAVFLDIRAFEQAAEVYNECASQEPLNRAHRYNLGESYFVMGQYKRATKQFVLCSQLSGAENTDHLASLCRFKLTLSLVGLAKDKNLSESERIEYALKRDSMIAKYSKRSYSLMYYYTMAAKEFDQGNEELGAEWVHFARIVFSKPVDRLPWEDSLIEFGFLKSYYGGDDPKKVVQIGE